MKDSRYILDPSSKKYICPQCRQQRFVRFIDKSSLTLAPCEYGRCDRSNNCKYFKAPPPDTLAYLVSFDELTDYSEKAFELDIDGSFYFVPKSCVFEVLENSCYIADYILSKAGSPPFDPSLSKVFSKDGFPAPEILTNQPYTAKPRSYITREEMTKSFSAYQNNNFVQWLLQHFDKNLVQCLCRDYNIGTTPDGSTIFWQVDNEKRVRSGKVIKYQSNGHRDKTIATACNWVHKLLKMKDYNLEQCLFGLHLLADKVVCIVESEKTAVVCAGLFTKYTWMSIGSKDAIFSDEKLSPLRNNKILLFPDIGAEQRWDEQAQSLRDRGYDAVVSDFLTKNFSSNEAYSGLDLADFLTISLKPASDENSLTLKNNTTDDTEPRVTSVENIVGDLANHSSLDSASYYDYPLRPAAGRLAELEDIFVRDTSIQNRQHIVRLLDRYKRIDASQVEIDELESLLQIKNTTQTKPASLAYSPNL